MKNQSEPCEHNQRKEVTIRMNQYYTYEQMNKITNCISKTTKYLTKARKLSFKTGQNISQASQTDHKADRTEQSINKFSLPYRQKEGKESKSP